MARDLRMFRRDDGSLDRKYLRVCAVYRMMKRCGLGKERALELLAGRHTKKEMAILRGTVELWLSGPLKAN